MSERQNNYGAFSEVWRKQAAETDAEVRALSAEMAQRVVRSEVALSDFLSASFHREAQSLTLVTENAVLFLDREETYKLLSLLEAEMKGVAS